MNKNEGYILKEQIIVENPQHPLYIFLPAKKYSIDKFIKKSRGLVKNRTDLEIQFINTNFQNTKDTILENIKTKENPQNLIDLMAASCVLDFFDEVKNYFKQKIENKRNPKTKNLVNKIFSFMDKNNLISDYNKAIMTPYTNLSFFASLNMLNNSKYDAVLSEFSGISPLNKTVHDGYVTSYNLDYCLETIHLPRVLDDNGIILLLRNTFQPMDEKLKPYSAYDSGKILGIAHRVSAVNDKKADDFVRSLISIYNRGEYRDNSLESVIKQDILIREDVTNPSEF